MTDDALPELRYADGPSTSASVEIAAPPSTVWALVRDINLPARFSPEFQGADWLDGAEESALGARFIGRNHHQAIGSWETTSTIVTHDDERELAYDVAGGGGPAASWAFRLEPTATGTRLTQWTRLGPGESGLTPVLRSMPERESQILHRRLSEHRASMEATLAGIKALAEGTDT